MTSARLALTRTMGAVFPAHRLDGALILLDLHRRVLAIEEDEIKAGVSQHRHVVFIQRPGCADNGLPRLQQISDRIHANKPPTSSPLDLADVGGQGGRGPTSGNGRAVTRPTASFSARRRASAHAPAEAAHPGDRALLQLRGFLPRVHRDLGVRRQRGDIDRGLQRMRRDVIRQHQDRCVAVPHEVARHAVQKIGLHDVEVVQVCLDRVQRHVGPPREEVGDPALLCRYMTVGSSGRWPTLWQKTTAATRSGALQQRPGKAATNAVAHVEELVDPEVIHEPELVVGERLPGWSTGTGPVDSPPLALRWSIVMQRKSSLNSSMALITAVGQLLTREFKPHRGDQQREAGARLLVADADVALVVERHGIPPCPACCGRAPQRAARALESSSRHGCAAHRLCGYSCTRSGAAGQGWQQLGRQARRATASYQAICGAQYLYRTGSTHCLCRHHQDMVAIASECQHWAKCCSGAVIEPFQLLRKAVLGELLHAPATKTDIWQHSSR